MAAVIGFVALGQQLDVIGWVAIALVCVSAIGVVLFPESETSPRPAQEQV